MSFTRIISRKFFPKLNFGPQQYLFKNARTTANLPNNGKYEEQHNRSSNSKNLIKYLIPLPVFVYYMTKSAECESNKDATLIEKCKF